MESVQNFFQNLVAKIRTYVSENPRKSGMIGVAVLLMLIDYIWIDVPIPHVSLAGEPLLEGGWLTNSVLTTIIVDILLIIAAVTATRGMKLVPGGWQNVMEAILEYLYGLAESVGGKAAKTYFPWAATIFLFVLISNWSGLIPGMGSIGVHHSGEHAVEEQHQEEQPEDGEEQKEGEGDGHGGVINNRLAMVDGKLILVQAAAEEGHAKFVPLFRAPSADLNVTLALGLVTMILVQYYGWQALGGKYFGQFFTLKGEGAMRFINGFVGLLELLAQFVRLIAFMFRLFGNIFAGEVVLATMAFLIAFLVPIPFYLLEILVGAVQALVFMMLALAFFTMSTIDHSHGDEHH